MAVTLEQVEALRARAEVSYEEARAALEDSGGDLLDALILSDMGAQIRRLSRNSVEIDCTRARNITAPIDLVRTAATALILVYHFAAEFAAAGLLPGAAWPAFGAEVGIELFFLLSGASLCWGRGGRFGARRYYAGRALAIYPCFWVGFAALFLYGEVLHGNNAGIPKWKLVFSVLGLDGYPIFLSPYAPVASDPGFVRGGDLGLPFSGLVYLFPAKANYMGGDIVSGMIATGIARSQRIQLFFDIGTNGELVAGCRDFLVSGAGAAGPALEGGVIRTGMCAAAGADPWMEDVLGRFCKATGREFAVRRIGSAEAAQPEGLKAKLKACYYRLPAPVNEEVRRKVIGDAKVITHRPADDIAPELEKYRKEIGQYITQEEDVLTYAMFPQVAPKFFEKRAEKAAGVDGDHVDYATKSHPV